MEIYNQKTCIRFRPIKKGDKSWIIIRGSLTGCSSDVGNLRKKGQTVRLNVWTCITRRTILHELMHVIGFDHQHVVSNRDEYVTVNWQNIQKDHNKNFQKDDENLLTDFEVGYDYDSVLHYRGNM